MYLDREWVGGSSRVAGVRADVRAGEERREGATAAAVVCPLQLLINQPTNQSIKTLHV
jgi:hypothetical protein